MSAVVITNCTGRKRNLAGGRPLTPPTDAPTLRALGQAWLDSLGGSTSLHPVRDLYVGRSVVESASVANAIEASLAFVSAGLGLVDANELRPAYNLTVSKGDGSIAPALARLGASASEWWDLLNASQGKPNPLRVLLESRTTHLVLLALPSGYLEMVFNDINAVGGSALKKLRVFTSAPGASSLPPRVQSFVMPYDKRLEAALPGTKGDFPQRAMRHFVETLCGHQLENAEQGRQAVLKALERLAAPELPVRARLPDEEIVALLERHWHRHGGQSGRLLRYLRDEALVACEQGRFRSLWLTAKTQIRPQ
jgi:hypothetical protein